jgi:hypothetical protein
MGDDWLKETLERCGNAPARVILNGLQEHQLTPARMSMISGALANNQRLEQLAVRAHADKIHELVSLLKPPTSIRSLLLNNPTDAVPAILPPTFFKQTAPRLETLFLEKVSSHWDGAPLSGLTVLMVEGTKNPKFELVSASAFLEALRSMSQLQELAVILPFLQPIEVAIQSPVIRLRRLQSFKLHGSCPTTVNLLKMLQLPVCTTVDLLDEEADATTSNALVDALTSSWLAFAPVSSPADTIHRFDNLTMKGWGWRGQLMTATSPQRTLELSLGQKSEGDRDAFEPRVLELLPLDKLKTLTIHRCGFVDAALPLLISAQHVILEGTRTTGLLLQCLGCMYDTQAEESPSLLFHKLQILEIRDTSFLSDDFDGELNLPWLVRFVRRQSAKGYQVREVLLMRCKLKRGDDVHELDEFVGTVKWVDTKEADYWDEDEDEDVQEVDFSLFF